MKLQIPRLRSGRQKGKRCCKEGTIAKGDPFATPSPPATAVSSSDRPLVQRPPSRPATALSFQHLSPVCHPERSEGSAVSSDLSWKCF
jgi:hypothetical protein